MIVSNNQTTGNRVESYIAFRLSDKCLVRHVTSGTDIGVDLYCELLRDGHPYLHFWVQLKGMDTSEGKVLKTNKISYSFSKKHLRYWEDQPVPVFIMHANIQDINSDQLAFAPIWIINVTEWLMENNVRLKNKAKSCSLHSNKTIRTKNDLDEFLQLEIERMDAIQKINIGVVAPLKYSKSEYVKQFPSVNAWKFSTRIFTTLRFTSATLLRQFVVKEIGATEKLLIDETAKSRRMYHEIVESIERLEKETGGHWEVPYSLGWSYLLENDIPNATTMFCRSFAICRNDKLTRAGRNEWHRQMTDIIYVLKVLKAIDPKDLPNFLFEVRPFIIAMPNNSDTIFDSVVDLYEVNCGSGYL